jgi:pimeloyl-ACP methyl ester carboxylesterase
LAVADVGQLALTPSAGATANAGGDRFLASRRPDHAPKLLGREVSWALRAATLPGADLVLPLIANSHVRAAGQAVGRLLHGLSIRPRPSLVELARGYGNLSDSPNRKAFVHTLRSVVEPGGQRVQAGDRHYLAEGRPTLIIWGAADPVIPLAHAYTAHAELPGSQLEIFEQSHHFPHMDEPARFTQVLLRFLDTTQPLPFDRAALKDRMINRSREITEPAGDETLTKPPTTSPGPWTPRAPDRHDGSPAGSQP